MVRTALVAVVSAAVALHTVAAWAQGYSVVGPEPSGRAAGATPTAPQDGRAAWAEATGSTASTGTSTAGSRMRVSAPGGRASAANDDYGGVVPGNHAVPPGLSRRAAERRDPIVVAWPGFQLTPAGSRLFLAVTAPPEITPRPARAGQRIYRLARATVPVRNNRRALETTAFATPVSRAYLRKRGRDVEFVVELRAPIEPRVSVQTDPRGLDFVYLDFDRWEPPTPPASAPAPSASSPAGGETETPPAIRR